MSIENSPEARALFDPARCAEMGPLCLSCATLSAEVAQARIDLKAERDQLREQLAAEREYSAGLRKVIENKNQDARAK